VSQLLNDTVMQTTIVATLNEEAKNSFAVPHAAIETAIASIGKKSGWFLKSRHLLS
jgi:hypothetical protein